MASAYTIFGSLSVDTSSFLKKMRDAENRLDQTTKAIDNTEKHARSLGQTTATSARGFEKMTDAANKQKDRINQLALAYAKGEISAKRLEAAIKSVGNATNGLNSRLRDSQARITDFANKTNSLASRLQSLGSIASTAGRALTVSITAPLTALGAIATSAAITFDTMRARLQGLGLTAGEAAQKFKELADFAQKTPGVMTELAVEAYSFLQPLGLTEDAIKSWIQTLGNLKLKNPMMDIAQFTRNWQQMFSTFSSTDWKEAERAFPLLGQTLQKAFNLSSSDRDVVKKEMQALIESGKITKEQAMSMFSEVVNASPAVDSIAIRFAKLKDRIFLALEPIGATILSVFEKIIPLVEPVIMSLANVFANLSPTIQTIVVAFGAVAAALGPVLMAVGAVLPTVISLGSAIAGAAAAVGGLAPLLGIAAAVIAGLTIQMAPLIASAVSLYTIWTTNFGGIRDLVQRVVAAIGSAWESLKAKLISLTQELHSQLKAFWEQNGQDILRAVQRVSDMIQAVWRNVLDFWESHGDKIKAVTIAVWNAVSGTIKTALNVILNVVKGVTALINGDWSKLWESIKNLTKIGLDAVVTLIEGSGQLVVAAVKTVLNAVWALHGWLYEQAKKLGKALMDGIVEGIIEGMPYVVRKAYEAGKAINDAYKAGFGSGSPLDLSGITNQTNTAKAGLGAAFGGVGSTGKLGGGTSGGGKRGGSGGGRGSNPFADEVLNFKKWEKELELIGVYGKESVNRIAGELEIAFGKFKNLGVKALSELRRMWDEKDLHLAIEKGLEELAKKFYETKDAMKSGADEFQNFRKQVLEGAFSFEQFENAFGEVSANTSKFVQGLLASGHSIDSVREILDNFYKSLWDENVQARIDSFTKSMEHQRMELEKQVEVAMQYAQGKRESADLMQEEVFWLKVAEGAYEGYTQAQLDSMAAEIRHNDELAKKPEKIKAAVDALRGYIDQAKSLWDGMFTKPRTEAELLLEQIMLIPEAIRSANPAFDEVIAKLQQVIEQHKILEYESGSFWESFAANLRKSFEGIKSIEQALGDGLVNAIHGIGDVFANAVTQWDGTAKGFFNSIAQGFAQMAQQIIAELIKIMIIQAIIGIVGAVGGEGAGESAAGLFGTNAWFQSGYADGGFVSGSGTSRSDSILARLSNGEFVMDAKTVRKYGKDFFEQLNSPFTPRFADGGFVGASGSSGTVTNYNNSTSNAPVMNITMNVSAQDAASFNRSKSQITREIGAALQRQMLREA